MIYIILAAGLGEISTDPTEDLPKILESFDETHTVLDKLLENTRTLPIDDTVVVGGFGILKIIERYPRLRYAYNPLWYRSGSLASLQVALPNIDDAVLVSYADVVYDAKVMKIFAQSDDDSTIKVAYDSEWKTRYEGRSESLLNEAEKLEWVDGVLKIGRSLNAQKALGEFAGIFMIPKRYQKAATALVQKMTENNPAASVGDLLERLSKNFPVEIVDICGHWAELDSRQDLNRFRFGTKAETLQRLEKKVKKSLILPQYIFTVKEYRSDPDRIIDAIQSFVRNDYIVIRSSARDEDTSEHSLAGNYESVLNVPSSSKEAIMEAIETVIKSFETKSKNGVFSSTNQILVQRQVRDVLLSGVVFTRDVQTRAPYYIVNYARSHKTDSVTSGNKGSVETLIIYRYGETVPSDPMLNKLIEAVKELEFVTDYESLDVEFAIKGNEIYIFQVRPIAAHKEELRVREEDIKKVVSYSKHFVEKSISFDADVCGRQSAYGVMPDWNPAEIIGIDPRPLDFSLYRYLITDTIWAESRAQLGYRKITNSPGMVAIGGKPYIDIRMSFNTLTPAQISERTAEKLVDYSIQKLRRKPYLHDKVEFEVVLNAYDFAFKRRLDELKKNGFTEDERDEILHVFKSHTFDLVEEKSVSIDKELALLRRLEKNREKILTSSLPIVDKIVLLLDDCRYYGTLPFAKLARLSFIGSNLILSLEKSGVVSKSFHEKFFQTVATIATKFVTDVEKLQRTEMSKEIFLEKYGHLRPGTYDICSRTYAEAFEFYFTDCVPGTDSENRSFFTDSFETDAIESVLKEEKAPFGVEQLLNFVRRAIEAREYAKFEFTKNLSAALSLIEKYAASKEIPVCDAAYFEISDFFELRARSLTSGVLEELRRRIDFRKREHLVTTAVRLPELIFEQRDFDVFELPSAEPNFITTKSVEAPLYYLDGKSTPKTLEGHIVLIEQADPGYDWIFSHAIAGLITKYGGVASHMAIRCAEFDLPAAIGCGEKYFEPLTKYSVVSLDCLKKKIIGLKR